METISNFFSILEVLELPQIGFTDILEIIIIAVILYYILLMVQNTRAWFLLRGIAVILVFFGVATVLRLDTILFIAENSISVIVMAIIVVFQPELRKMLEHLGQNKTLFTFFGGNSIPDENQFDQTTIDELVKASYALGRTRTGALIVIERELPLEEYVRTGITVDAVLSSSLLINIFEHNTPLHDGAVIVRGNRVVSATCYLPLSQNTEIPKELGTRHRAAIGVSEVTDSVTLVVSEETGKVSVAEGGALSRNLTPVELQQKLQSLHPPVEEPRGIHLKCWKGRQKNEEEDSE